jgi:Tfp pilus assembly protein PilE
MRRGSKLRSSRMARPQAPQRGYILISLMLMFALIAIAALAVLPDMVHEIKRDREQEMCRRGTQYMRAIQHYYKKLGRYPSKIEDLESTNNMRFLRRRYKDPLMKDAQGHDKDFKLLHMQDVMLNNGPMLGGATGLAGLMGQAGALSQAGAGGLQGLAGAQGLGGLQGMAGAQGLAALQGGLAQAGQLGGMQGGQSTTVNLNGSSDSQSGSQGNSDSSGSSSSNSGSNSGSTTTGQGGSISASGPGLTGQTFGGGPILGVASTSKEKTIREYNKKNHYNDWYFIYDASALQVGLLVGPWQPMTMTSSSNLGTPVGQMGQGQGTSQSGFGAFGQQQGGFGQPQSGFGQSGFGQSPQNPPAQNNGNTPQN